MKILVIGGTLFAGRAVVAQALTDGHDVTLFNRGRTNAGLFPEAEHLRGDRDHDLSALAGRSFDAVIDPSGYFPRQVEAVAEVLEGRIGHYTFVSSASVYATHDTPGADETAALDTVDDPTVEELGENYGGFKALCEQALDDAMPGRVHHVRAGLIVGPHDNTGRFTYWVQRLDAGGRVLAPEPGDQPVQFIDVRDLAAWILHAASNDLTGPVNAINNPEELTMATMLDQIANTLGSDAELAWVGERFLVDQGVEPWSDLPLWLPPESLPTHVGFMTRSNARAVEAGMTLRPLAETVEATRSWLDEREVDPNAQHKDFGNANQGAGLTPERERALLDAWDRTVT